MDSHPRHGWLVKAVEKRLRQELAKLNVTINEEKSRTVNLSKGESFCFLGFEYRRILSRNQVWRPQYTPRLKKRTALFAKLREIFRRFTSQPVERVIELINPSLRGGVHYFAVTLKPMLLVRQRLGRKEDSTAPDAIPETSRIRLAKVE
jgi:RNA-directed DNA polymerase